MNCLRLRQPDRERGAALFLAILTLFILTIMGIALMFTTSIENTLAGTETKVSKIFYAADSGVEYAGAMLSAQPALHRRSRCRSASPAITRAFRAPTCR